MRLLSKACIYGIRASLFIASIQRERKFVPIREISAELGISFYFLTKIMQTLTQHNITTSYRGPNGGVSLARPACEISLMDMISALEQDGFFEGCVLGLPSCGMAKPCPFHAFWDEPREKLKSAFENTTLESLGRGIREHDFRLST